MPWASCFSPGFSTNNGTMTARSSFLDVLEQTRCRGYEHYCWGYPYDWTTLRGTIKQGTPLITTVPYVYEAFKLAYQTDGSDRWLRIMHSIAEHAFQDYKDIDTSAERVHMLLYAGSKGLPVCRKRECLSSVSPNQRGSLTSGRKNIARSHSETWLSSLSHRTRMDPGTTQWMETEPLSITFTPASS